MEPTQTEIAEIILAWCFADEHNETTEAERARAKKAAEIIHRAFTTRHKLTPRQGGANGIR